jgi:hypothetical protein
MLKEHYLLFAPGSTEMNGIYSDSHLTRFPGFGDRFLAQLENHVYTVTHSSMRVSPVRRIA